MAERASRAAIIAKLDQLLGAEASQVVASVVEDYAADQVEQGLSELARFDQRIGGHHGVFSYVIGSRYAYDMSERSVYRPFLYVYYVLEKPEPQHLTRVVVNSSCVHIESVLKSWVRVNFFGRVTGKLERLPLGGLLRSSEVKRQLPDDLLMDLLWLNDTIYIFGKHGFSAGKATVEEEGRLFELDEAVAIYFIARCLGWRLETILKAQQRTQFGYPPLDKT